MKCCISNNKYILLQFETSLENYKWFSTVTDETCICSILYFIAARASKYGFAPVVTLDQPLRWKAMRIVAAKGPASFLSTIVLKLGGFLVMMSYIGCIGQIMASCWLKDVL